MESIELKVRHFFNSGYPALYSNPKSCPLANACDEHFNAIETYAGVSDTSVFTGNGEIKYIHTPYDRGTYLGDLHIAQANKDTPDYTIRTLNLIEYE